MASKAGIFPNSEYERIPKKGNLKFIGKADDLDYYIYQSPDLSLTTIRVDSIGLIEWMAWRGWCYWEVEPTDVMNLETASINKKHNAELEEIKSLINELKPF